MQLNTTKLPSNTSATVCPEEELPTNIGPYEVPTQRDLVKHMKAKLLKVFNKYHEKALYFLKDIKEATRATSELELKCPTVQRETYRRCVRHVNKQCREITRSLVSSLESQRHDVITLTEGPICNMSAMRTDPVQLIKLVAMEAVSLEFALPGFLRLLGACSYYCNISHISAKQFKPTRHLTDQQLVVNHLLTRKNYVQLIKAAP
ncbi:hypothetical protein evm_008970 [Chilo suppressalis]|nr:hypothetical protein evm_008970 [Chilo suppressalis]